VTSAEQGPGQEYAGTPEELRKVCIVTASDTGCPEDTDWFSKSSDGMSILFKKSGHFGENIRPEHDLEPYPFRKGMGAWYAGLAIEPHLFLPPRHAQRVLYPHRTNQWFRLYYGITGIGGESPV